MLTEQTLIRAHAHRDTLEHRVKHVRTDCAVTCKKYDHYMPLQSVIMLVSSYRLNDLFLGGMTHNCTKVSFFSYPMGFNCIICFDSRSNLSLSLSLSLSFSLFLSDIPPKHTQHTHSITHSLSVFLVLLSLRLFTSICHCQFDSLISSLDAFPF